MEHYALGTDEVVLYKNNVRHANDGNKSCELILTNINLVLIKKEKIRFGKSQFNVYGFPMSDIKIYEDMPQIKHHKDSVELYFVNSEQTIIFDSSIEASKFTNAAYKLITGKSMSGRGAEKVKNAIHLVDDTLGINTVGTVKNVLENGVVGSAIGGIGKLTKAAKIAKTAKDIGQALDVPAKQATAKPASYDEQLEALGKLKSLLDAGILTQEEFDTKKKEILGI